MSTQNHGSLQEEIQQTKPFRSRREEGTLALLRTASFIRRRVSAVVEPFGLSNEQYNVLRILRGAGRDGLATLEVAERMIEPTPAITRLLDKLEGKKLVRRKRCPADRRRVLCFITPDGLQLLTDLDQPVNTAGDAQLSMLSDEELGQMISLLDRIRAG